MKLAVIVGTRRQGRVTPRVAKWVQKTISDVYPDAEVKVLDLAEFNIPLLDEAPWVPDRVLNDDSKRWLDELAWADGYVIATAEYYHSIPAVLKNALEYTAGQMKRKPVLIVSHGSVSGARAAEHLRLVLGSMIAAVSIPHDLTFVGNVSDCITEDGELTEAGQSNDQRLRGALDELAWYTQALTTARE